MARVCQFTGKRTTSGQNRPFSMKATKRTFRANLFTKKIWNPLTGKIERMKLSAKAIKTIKKMMKDRGIMMEHTKIAESQSKKAAAARPNAGTASRAGAGKHVHKKKLTPKQKKEEAAHKEAELLGKKIEGAETES